MDMQKLGAHLQSVRRQRRYSQQEVADALGISRTAVTNLESGRRKVSSLEISKLADLYSYPVAKLLDAEQPLSTDEFSAALERVVPELARATASRRSVQRLIYLCGIGVELQRWLHRAVDSSIPEYPAVASTVGDAARQGEEVAEAERRRLQLGSGPIRDVAKLMIDQGIWVAASKLPSKLSGLFFDHPEVGPAILINQTHWLVRRRFSYAHEYAHVLLDREERVVATRRGVSDDLREVRANAFAAAFLMPAGAVTKQLQDLGKGQGRRPLSISAGNEESPIEVKVRAPSGAQTVTYQDVAVLARHFRVSFDAMVWRLRSCKLLNRDTADFLITQRSAGNKYIAAMGFVELVGKGPMRPEDAERELRSRLMHLAVEAYRRSLISRGRLLEIGRHVDFNEELLQELADAN